VVVAVAVAAAAHAAPSAPAPAKPTAKPTPTRPYLGTFEPAAALTPCADCRTAQVVPSAGSVRVLPPGVGVPPANGDVVIASPLVGLALHATLTAGKIALPWFAVDTRDSATGVLVLPADAAVRFVSPSPADVLAIKQALVAGDALSTDNRATALRALRDLEVAAIDTDGDHKADLAVTYGCTSYGDGACQRRGQFFLARRGALWVQID
jgi:hypothetical protein